MKIPISWLQEFIHLTNSDPTHLAEKLTMAGVEVGGIEIFGDIPESVVVAKLEKVSPHPDADRLSLCRVHDGNQTYDVVCGAHNMKDGDHVALAKVGSRLPNGVKIKRSKIRGQVSDGMLCSEIELGLGQDADGIIILDEDTKPGAFLTDALSLKDVLLDVEVTPNRGDCLSIIGIARELAVLGCGALNLPMVKETLAHTQAGAVFAAKETGEVPVRILNPDRCPRYMLQRVDIPALSPTPPWMKKRLEQCGLRSINLVVDVTNYVLLEWGQPLHAFDFNKVQGGEVVVRTAEEGEAEFEALDENRYRLTGEDLAICDQKRPLCVAGLIGGRNSEVTETTRRVLLEAACFESTGIRKSSKRLGVSTDSSYRFERGVDPEVTPYALARAVTLLEELTGAQSIGSAVDHNVLKGGGRLEIEFRPSRFKRIMGYSIPERRIGEIFDGLGVERVRQIGEKWNVLSPSWRPDLTREIDLIEELGRVEGYEKLKETLPRTPADVLIEKNNNDLILRASDFLQNRGFFEVKNLSFISPKKNEFLGNHQPIQIVNPLGEEFSQLRPLLLPGLLQTLEHNFNHFRHYKRLCFFETNHIFSGQAIAEEFPNEFPHLSGVAWQDEEPLWTGTRQTGFDFYWIKGIIEGMLQLSRIRNLEYRLIEDFNAHSGVGKILHPNVNSLILWNKNVIGVLGEIHPNLLPEDLNGKVVGFEIFLELLYSHANSGCRYQNFSRFPVVHRDMALVVDEGIEAAKLSRLIGKAGRGYVREVRPVDLYIGKQIAEGKKSIAFRIYYQAADRTLKDSEVDRFFDQALGELEKNFSATLRSL